MIKHNFYFTGLIFVAWLLLFYVNEAFGRIEGFIFPVVKDFTVITDYQGHVSGSFFKIRQCDFEGIDWLYTNEGYRSKVQVEFLETAKVRKGGLHKYGPWSVNMSKPDIKEHSMIEVRHRCHPFWTTITQVYP